MKVERFEELECWKSSREIVKQIYTITRQTGFNKDYGLKDQIQRAGVSIMSNIAEGFDSHSDKSFINFLSYSYRSASEVQSLLYAAYDLSYINKQDFDELYSRVQNIQKMISGLTKYLSGYNKT